MNDKGIEKVFEAGVWYTISNIAVKAISIIATPIYTRIISTEDYGISATFCSWYSLLFVFFSLNLTYSIARAKQDFPGKLSEYISSMQTLSLCFTVFIGIVAFVFIVPLAKVLDMDSVLVIILLVYLMFGPTVEFVQNKYRYEYRYKENIVITIYISIFTVILTLGLIVFFDEKRYLGKVLGTVIPIVILAIYFWIVEIRKKEIKVNTTYWKYGLMLSVPLIVHTVSMNILSQADRIMITRFCGESFTGIYNLAYQYALLINIIMYAVSNAWTPWFFDKYALGDFEDIRTAVKPMVILGCYIGIGCIAIAPEAISILGSSEYRSGQWIVAPIVLGVIFQYIYTHYVNIELQLKKTKYISCGTIVAAILNIVLNAVFIPIYGYQAAAYTTLMSYLLLLLIHFFTTRFILKVHIYDDKFMFICILIVVGITIIFVSLYNFTIIRWILIIMISLGYLIQNRNLLVKFIKR